jgi:hypothetical protein
MASEFVLEAKAHIRANAGFTWQVVTVVGGPTSRYDLELDLIS